MSHRRDRAESAVNEPRARAIVGTIGPIAVTARVHGAAANVAPSRGTKRNTRMVL